MKVSLAILLTALFLLPLSSSASVLRGSRSTSVENNADEGLLAAIEGPSVRKSITRESNLDGTQTIANNTKPTLTTSDCIIAGREILEQTPHYCPSSISHLYENLPGLTSCSSNADCAGITQFGHQNCCVYPLCICGFADTSGDEHVCVSDQGSTTPAPTPAPTSPPPPPPVGRTCPTSVSEMYQAFPNVQPCFTNADCVGFVSQDGPTCCVSPQCVCGVQELGASGYVGCVVTRRDRALFEQVLGKDLPEV